MQTAPSFASIKPAEISIPLRFIAAGVCILVSGMAWICLRPDVLATYHYNQWILALTHLWNLGWLATIVMGAMYQLVPVALETRLYSPRLARWHFLTHLAGTAGMVWSFWTSDFLHVGITGSLVGVGFVLFAWNIARTIAGMPKWNLTAAAVAAATAWLVLTLLAGLFIAFSKHWVYSPFSPIPQMHAHAHLGGIGFFMVMLVGVGYKLVPMFTLSDVQSPRRAAASVLLLNVGLVGLFFTMLYERPEKLAFAIVILAALALFGLEMRAILRARKRSQIDWALRYFFTGLALLLPVAAAAVVLSWPGLPANAFTTQLENVYGFLVFAGVLTLAILGMLYKILPFLVWYARYSPWVGRRKVPGFAELFSARIQVAGYWCYVAGLLATSVAIAFGHAPGVQAGCVALLAGVVLCAINYGLILSHLWSADPAPAVALKPSLQTQG